jgi:type II secretory ATPase GspE/PulE/Tfp pilus assembly ATPase PilB-like protein
LKSATLELKTSAEHTTIEAKLPVKRRPLGQTLIERGLLTDDQLRIALMEQKTQGIPLGKVLVAMGFLTEATLREALAQNLGHREIDLSRLVPNSSAMRLVTRDFAKRHLVFPVSVDDDESTLTLALSNPNDIMALDKINADLEGRYRLVVCIATEGEVSGAIDLHYGHELSIDGILNEIETGETDLSSLDETGNEYSGPVIRLIDAILTDAIQRRSSDIHFEPEAGFLRIRYRVDGVLRQIRVLHAKFWPSMAVRLKIIAGMNIAETRAPQDGRISLLLNGRQIDFRAAVHPTIYGENFVLRILDRNSGMVALEKMDLRDTQVDAIEMMIARPEGMILVTGPTGSGKTTTLYSILARLNKEGVNIMTLEDPVEYPLPMVRQSNLASSAKLDFSGGIRSLMRQDPDIILVGEVRDADTATQALRAAMTGHLVFTTLHSNSAIGAIPRLQDLGLSAELMAGALIGVIGQRLVRKLCTHCKKPVEIDRETARALQMPDDTPAILFLPEGCIRCDYQGYKGRLALLEVLRFDEELDDLVARKQPLREILRAAKSKGYTTLADDALRRIITGQTSLEEAARVVDLTGISSLVHEASDEARASVV